MKLLQSVHRVVPAVSLLVFAASVALAAPVAIVTDVQGRAALIAAGRSANAGILADIEPGTQLQLQADSHVVVLYLADGSEYLLQGPAQVTFRADRPEISTGAPAVRRAAPAGLGPKLRSDGLQQGAIVLRSLGSLPIRLLSANSTLLLEARPELRWAAPESGLRYRVDIGDDNGRSLYQADVDGNSFIVPANLALREGASYAWHVSARGPDGRSYAGRGSFTVAGAALRAQVDAARRETGSAMSSQVAFALWLEQQELRDEARKLWQMLAAQRPLEPHLREMAER